MVALACQEHFYRTDSHDIKLKLKGNLTERNKIKKKKN